MTNDGLVAVGDIGNYAVSCANISQLAVSTRPPDGVLLAPAALA